LVESDEETSFVSNSELKYLEKKSVDYNGVIEQRYNNRNIIDEFIRTWRDWTRINKSMTIPKINPFINTYNRTRQQTTGVSPAQMQDNKDLEVQHIVDSINKPNNVDNIRPDYKLTVNDKGRQMELKKALKKARYNVTPYYDTIVDISDKSITITDIDGSVKTVAIPQIIPINRSTKIKEAKSIRGISCGSVTEILRYYPKKDFYKVKLDVQDENNSYIDAIKAKERRAHQPLEYSKIIRKYLI
jgi:hypothetical protein